MNSWLPLFIAVTALAVVLQVVILWAMYFSIRQTGERLTRMGEDLQRRLEPILSRLQYLIEDTQPRISAIAANAAEISELARGQAQKVDRVFTEAVDRLRSQIVRADQILTGALETVEDSGSHLKRAVWAPVQQATAVLRGIKAGLDLFRGQKRAPQPGRSQSDEELFI